jgi:hypothetical protein
MRRTPYRSPLRPLERLEDRATPATHLFATGVQSGAPPRVNVYSLDTPTSFHQVASFLAYPAGFGGGVTVATDDLNGDGIDDVVTGAGPGGGPAVEVWDGASLLRGKPVLLRQFYAYDPSFTGGVFVAAGLISYSNAGGGVMGIVTGAGRGGAPHVRVFRYGDLSVYYQFYAYDRSFTGGVRVALDSIGTLVTGAGPGGGPHVKVYDRFQSLVAQFFAYDPSFTGGVFVASGRFLVPGTTSASVPNPNVVVAPGPGGPTDVRVYFAYNPSDQGVPPSGYQFVRSFVPYPGFQGGVTLGVTADNTNFHVFLITAPGPLGGPDVRLYKYAFQPTLRFNAYDPSFLGGVFVG